MTGMMPLVVLFFASLWAGCQNALAGGGSFITLPALIFTGMDARAANITSTVALFPGQVASAIQGRAHASGTSSLSLKALTVISLAGGAVGAVLLLLTPSAFFAKLVPWLVLFATSMFGWGSFGSRRVEEAHLGPRATGSMQFLIAVYGGYFGGGIGFLMLAALTAAGLAIRNASASKNMLAGVMNASALAIFVFSPQVHWQQAIVAGVGAIIGGVSGAILLNRVNEKALRAAIVVIGIALTIGLFLRAP